VPDPPWTITGPAATTSRRIGLRVTDRDRLVLEFIAEHRLVLASHVQALLGASTAAAARRLRALVAAGLLSTDTLFHRHPACFQITRHGLGVVQSRLPRPKLDYRNYAHDVGVAWLWLAARAGSFGTIAHVISEREMRSRDGSARNQTTSGATDRAPLGVPLGGFGPDAKLRLHYPDLLLVDARGRRIAVELELTPKNRARREKIIGGYAADARVDGVLYLVTDARVGRALRETARRFGFERRLQVQQVQFGGREVPIGDGMTRQAAARRQTPGPLHRARGHDSAVSAR
jgi:hypothetical protein